MASPMSERPNPAGTQVASFDADFTGSLGGYPEPPPVEGIDLRTIWAVLRRYWVLIVASVTLVGMAGWFWTNRMTPAYEALASLRIAANESVVPGLEVLKGLNGQGSEVNTELLVLKSRALADSVVARLDLRLAVVEPRGLPRSRLVSSETFSPTSRTGLIIFESSSGHVTVTGPDSTTVTGRPGDTVHVGATTLVLARSVAAYPRAVLSLDSQTGATAAFVAALRVARPSRDANILTVTVRHSDPEMAAAAADALLAVFLEQRVATRRTGARSTVDFLRTQLDTLSLELRKAEDSLKAFREVSQVVAIETQATVSVGKLAELKAARDEVASELQALDTVLVRNLATPADAAGGSAYQRLLSFPTLLRNPSVSALLTSLSVLENERATLLTRRTARDPEVVTLTAQINGVEAQMRGVVTSYTDGLRAEVAAYDRTLAKSAGELRIIPAKEVQLARLMRSTTVLGELSTLLQTRLKEAEIAKAVEDPSAQVVDLALVPDKPILPRRNLNLMASLFLGLMLALGIVYARESFDDKVHSRDDLQRVTQLPVLGVVPHFALERPVAGRRLGIRVRKALKGPPPRIEVAKVGDVEAGSGAAALDRPAWTILEAYRVLRASLAFSLAERPPKIVVITSPARGDGKSTTSANLAASLAQQKLKVLLIDADLRQGALHRTLGGIRQPGLSEVLTGRADFAAVTQQLTFGGIGRIDLISTGTVPPDPAELLSSHRLVDLLEAVEPLYDTILLDSPPVNIVSDALVLAPHADGVLLVVRGERTERGAVRFAIEQLASVRAKVIGTVLNDFDSRRPDGYGGYYSYGSYYAYGSRYGGPNDPAAPEP